MAASHICMSCGLDLARIQAVVDPHYGLPLVACPDCRAVAVRRTHWITARWRQAMRTFAAIRAILVRLLAAAALMGASVGLVLALEAWADERGETSVGVLPSILLGDHVRASDDDRIIAGLVVTAWVAVQAGVGVLLSVGLGHWRSRVLAWGGWAAALVLLLSLEAVVYPIVAAMGWVLRDPVAYDGPEMSRLAMRSAVGLGAMLAAPLGVPIGWGLAWAGGCMQRMKLRGRRRRRRVERESVR